MTFQRCNLFIPYINDKVVENDCQLNFDNHSHLFCEIVLTFKLNGRIISFVNDNHFQLN